MIPRRIAIADDDADSRAFVETSLQVLGHQVVCSVANGAELVEACAQLLPDLVLTDIQMPDMDGITAVARICEQRPVPVILLSAYHSEELIERAEAGYIMAYLVKPISHHALEPCLAVAWSRFEQFLDLQRETLNLRQAMEDRKIVEKAKTILMRQARLDENTAFRRLQKLASQKSRKLIDVAQMIVTADEAMFPGE